MRSAIIPLGAITLLCLGGCAGGPEGPREPTVEAQLIIMEAMRDARAACAAGLARPPQDCVDRGVAAAVARAERREGRRLFADPDDAADTRARSAAAFQAAVADCRVRGISRRSARWEYCNIDRAIARLHEAAR
ncbi:hypothetical protein [Muricoccus radiodurans]|uniref:hypothetical protein n=1 Tax=Muricoccus radiodurans TaxID=2231721 RepID=UPI003CE82EC2